MIAAIIALIIAAGISPNKRGPAVVVTFERSALLDEMKKNGIRLVLTDECMEDLDGWANWRATGYLEESTYRTLQGWADVQSEGDERAYCFEAIPGKKPNPAVWYEGDQGQD